tara:strand:- start:405 stop:722 length:318 start_codon:yes stop_codon:yes gene_type:complete
MKEYNSYLDKIFLSLQDDKAIDPKIIDLREKTFFADYMVIASGNSSRHITSMAEHLKEKLNKKRKIRIEGMNKSDWVLIDCNEIIVHIFLPEARSYYNLEKIWAI